MVLSRGWGDCDDLAPWRVAELQEAGEKATIHSDHETEMAPGVWVRLGPTPYKLQLVFEAPKNIAITRRRQPTG